MNETDLFFAYRGTAPARTTTDDQRAQARERKRRERQRYRELGLTERGEPRLAERRVVSWARGPHHLPRPGNDQEWCRDCLRPIRSAGPGKWRHR